MSDIAPKALCDRFLHEPNLGERIKFTNQLLDGRTPNEAVSALFGALNIAIDQLRAVLEIVVQESDIDSAYLIERMHTKLEARSADYVNHQFNQIVGRER